jgi:GTP cyclohydrolase I
MDATVPAPGIRHARYVIRDAVMECAVDGEPFTCDIEIAFTPSGATLELGHVAEVIVIYSTAPTTAERLAADLANWVQSVLSHAEDVRVVVRHHAKGGVELVVEA